MFKIAVFLLSIFRLGSCENSDWPFSQQLKFDHFSNGKESFTLITDATGIGDLWSSVPEMSFDVVEVEQIVYKNCTRQWRDIGLNINRLECNTRCCPQFWNLDLDIIPNDFHFPPFQHDGRCAYLSGNSSDWRLGARLKHSDLAETCIPLADLFAEHATTLAMGKSCQPQMKLLYTECQERVSLRYRIPFPSERSYKKTPLGAVINELDKVESLLALCRIKLVPLEQYEYYRDHEIMVRMENVDGHVLQLKSLHPQPNAFRDITPEQEVLVFFPNPDHAHQCIVSLPFRESPFNCEEEIFSAHCVSYQSTIEHGPLRVPVYDNAVNRLVANYRCLKQ